GGWAEGAKGWYAQRTSSMLAVGATPNMRPARSISSLSRRSISSVAKFAGGIGPTQRKHNRAPYAASSVSRQRSTSPRASILRRRTRCKTTRSAATGLAIASTATARRACDICRGAAAFQRCFDQPAKRQALRRRRGLSVVGDLRLEPGNGFVAGDIGEHSLDIPSNGHLQLRAAFQLGEGRVEQGAPPLEELAYALLVGHPRAKLYRQNRRRSHELLDHLLMGDEQVAQI